ncbi:O-antigen ligase family protein [Geitlerinema sp. CS-897]|nr:O-antigen ligase family protein [Geitlerinema sp. CS-897]
MNRYYTVLFALSIVLIHPWGDSRSEIWTQPKVAVLGLIVFSNFWNLTIGFWQDDYKLSRRWTIQLGLWLLFLAAGLFSTFNSPFPDRSFFGQPEMGDGWLYWCLIAAFTLSNSLLLKQSPQLMRSQAIGLLVGGVILAMASLPQLVNWKIDYTATSGQLLQSHILASTIFQNHQPIGFYSHRGHASVVLAMSATLALALWQQHGLKRRDFILAFSLLVLALLFNGTRMAILALLVSLADRFGQKYYKQLAIAVLLSSIVVGIQTSNKQISGLSIAKQITSDRIYLWDMTLQGIRERPGWGWGFDGFGVAFIHVKETPGLIEIVSIDDFKFTYLHRDGSFRQDLIRSSKGHNIVLDSLVSIGIIGTSIYSLLWIFYSISLYRSPYRRFAIAVIAYLMFTLTWFECAQYTHLAWWILSCADCQDLEAK